MNETTWLDYVTAIGSILTPIIVVILTIVSWKYRQSVERRIKLEERLREDRIEIYNKILEPFVMFMMSDTAWKKDNKNKNKNKDEEASKLMLSLEYRKFSTKFILMGSDDVVIAFNNILKFFYNQTDITPTFENLHTMMALIGNLLLSIRKSMGNEATKLDNWGILEWCFTDAEEHRKIDQNICH